MIQLDMMAGLPCVCGHERRQHNISRGQCAAVTEAGEKCHCDFFKFHADTDYFAFHAELLVVAKSFNVRWPKITHKIVEILRADRNVMAHEEKLLSELFSYISDRVKHSFWGTGIYTSQDGDENDIKWHNACLELEKRGLICRKIDAGDHVLWMPKQ